MSGLNRRTFVHLSTAAMLTAASKSLLGDVAGPTISRLEGLIRVKGQNYTWEYRDSDDTFRLLDSGDRLIVSGALQPAVVVLPPRILRSGNVSQVGQAAHT